MIARAGRHFTQPRPVTLFGETINGLTQIVIWGDPRHTTQVNASHRSGQKENSSKDEHGGSPLE